jgi:nitrile hydratase subunit beta
MTFPCVNDGFALGDRVTVKRMCPPGHIRTPRYIMGLSGEICQVLGEFPNPEELAYGRDGKPEKRLYRVRFRQADVWADYQGAANDTLEIEIYGHWLMQATDAPSKRTGAEQKAAEG